MLCKPCEIAGIVEGGASQRRARHSVLPTCDACGAIILTLRGVAVGVGDSTLAQLGQFGLAVTGEPLLEVKREGT
jgi:hypothetical protein